MSPTPLTIETENLRLISATVENTRAACRDKAKFAQILQADVTESWPPEIATDVQEWTAQKIADLAAAGKNKAPWWTWYVVLKGDEPQEPDVLIGTGGFKGPPQNGIVEVGCAILEEFQGDGYATEMTEALIAWAFSHDEVTTVIAETYPHLIASQKVMKNCGMIRSVKASRPELLRFEVSK